MASNQKLYIRKNSKIHSSGLFAKTDITEGTRIIEYRGLKVTKAQSDKIADVHIDANKKKGTIGAVYIFTLNERYDINGKVSWNLAKYINHSCDPNCETDIIRGKIWIKQKLYEPIKFTFGNNPERPEQYIEVDITSYVPLHNGSLFNSFNPDAREVIDLRE